MWRKFSSPLPETLNKDYLRLIPSLRCEHIEDYVFVHLILNSEFDQYFNCL
jgi:hypothetical protein